MRTKQIDLLALCQIPKLNWHLLAREARRSGGLEQLLSGHVSELPKSAPDPETTLRAGLNRIAGFRAQAERIVEAAEAHGTRLTTVLDDDYPLNLLTVFNAPPFLFYRGELRGESDAMSVAVVGTRQASAKGLAQATRLAGLLVQAGVTVVSGLAAGIDTAAHTATLDAGGRTVAVIGTGINHVFPSHNGPLCEAIAARGAVVSQFWPDTPPATFTFPRRNVTMSGFSQGTAVIEAGPTSGAKMQARLALEHGKKVFLLKHLVTVQKWARGYLDRGAIEVGAIEDIIKELKSPGVIRERTAECLQLKFDLA